MMTHFFVLLRLLTTRWPAYATRPGRAFGLLALLLGVTLPGRAQYQVRTFTATDITVSSATLGAQAYYAGNSTRPSGVAYRQGSGDPTTADTVVPLTLLPTNPCQTCYTGTAQGLQPGKQYQVRAFIVTSSGTTYGDTETFETPPLPYQPPVPAITVMPPGPLVLGAGGSITLAASTTLPGFNLTGTGFDGDVTAVLAQPDGKVLVGGSFTTYNGNPAAPARLLRFLADGALDVIFNPVVAGTSGAGPNGAVRALVLQPDGKVLVGGDFTAYNGDANASDRVLRLNADGSLDATFNHPNSQVGAGANAGTNNTGVNALVLQSDGKVLVGGGFSTYNGAAAPGRVLRLNANGSLDVAFNNLNGQLGAGANFAVQALALQSNGQVLVGGQFTAYNGVTIPARLLRLNADGSLDPSFNNGGTGFDSGVRVLLVQPDGAVLVGGAFTTYNGDASAANRVLRLNANGSLDTGFNYGPTAGTTVAGGANANSLPAPVNALALLPSTQVLVGGLFTLYNENADAPDNLLRLNANGSLDASFTVVTTSPGLSYTWSNGATGPNLTVRQPGDYQVTATRQGRAYYSRVVRVSAPPAATVQVAPGGPLVLPAGGSATLTATATRPGFNVGGAGFDGDVRAVLVLPDGKVLAGSDFTSYNGNAAAPDDLLRLNPDGSLDTSFNPGITGTGRTVYALALQPDGKIVVGSDLVVSGGPPVNFDQQASSTTLTAGLVRLNPDGSLDTSFAVASLRNSVVVGGGVHPFSYQVSHLYALALQPDGKVLVGGKFDLYNGVSCLHNLVRVNPDGSLDAGFNYGGSGSSFVLTVGGVSSNLDFVGALVVQPNGKIVVGGSFNYYNGRRVSRSLMRLNDDGTRDFRFNLGNDFGGIMHFDYPDEAGLVFALALQPDGKIVVGGQFQQWNNQQGYSIPANRLVRLNEDGTYDAGFNPPGFSNNEPDDQRSRTPVRALAVQPDGKIVVGGDFTEYDLYNNPLSRQLYYRNRLLRLEPNGILNPTTDFPYPAVTWYPTAPGYINMSTTPLGGANNNVYALALQPDGQVLVGGAFTAYHANAATPDRLMRLTPAGLLNDAATPLAGATYAFNPGNTPSNSFAVSQPGTYTATATDPATGFSYSSNAVTVTFAPLPVELTAFTATLAGPAAVRLAWATASEKNSASFEVERSLDGRTFARIGTVPAAGTSSAPRSYELPDNQLPAGAALLYYRLRQVDLDGTFSYSPVRTVALTGAAAGLSLFPNPAHGGAATLTGAAPGTVVTVFDALGREVTRATADASGTAALALPAGLPTGVYVVHAGAKAVRLAVE